MKKAAVVFFVIICCSRFVHAQIVNIETSRLQSDTTGWMGSLQGKFALTKNVNTVLQLDGIAHVQYKTKKNLYLLLVNYSLLRGADQRLVDNGFFHFRYNHKLSKIIRWEAFTQVQNNVVTKINLRWLLGTGPRFKLVDNDQLKLFAASLVMYEVEEEKTDPIVTHKDFRNSSYVSLSWQLNKTVELISTTFYQPLLKNFNDFRLLNQEQCRAGLTSKLSLTIDWNYLYDRFPAADAPKTNYVFTTGIRYDL